MTKSREIIPYIFVLLFVCCTVPEPIESNIQSRVTEISFECNLLDVTNDEKILKPYEMHFHMLIKNTTNDTLYFGSSNVYGLRDYGYFVLVSPSDSIEFTTIFESAYAIPPNNEFDVNGWHSIGFEALKKFTTTTKTNRDEVYDKINKYKLLFIPHLESFSSSERKHLIFPTEQTFDLDSVIVSYLSEGKAYLDFDFSNAENNEF